MLKKCFIAVILFGSSFTSSHSQGCSDAGFCTAGALRPHEEKDTSYQHAFKIAWLYGKGEQGITILQIVPEFEFTFHTNSTIQIKAPYTYLNGNLGTVGGIGDITIGITQQIWKRNKMAFAFTIGGKIPTGDAGLKKDQKPLPMPYQVSLGTYDLILGAAFQYNKWNVGAGFQGILSDKNNNGFLREFWKGNLKAEKYFESNRLRRGNDILLRAEHTLTYKKFNFSGGLLGIYRIQKDKINAQGEQVKLKGSDGLTLNLTGGINCEISSPALLSLSFGTPLVVRDVRPDGLTRSLVLSLSYQVRFGKKKSNM